MAYDDFTIAGLEQRFGVATRETSDLFRGAAEVDLPPILSTTLDRYTPLARDAGTGKARSEMVTAPMLAELKFQHRHQLSFFSGVEFDVDPAAGLTGRCDFLLARSPRQLDVDAPACVAVVEAGDESIVAGIPRATARMIAARRFNEAAGTPIDPIYGAVTTGLLWRFLRLEGNVAHVDAVEYPIQFARKIFGILTAMALGE